MQIDDARVAGAAELDGHLEHGAKIDLMAEHMPVAQACVARQRIRVAQDSPGCGESVACIGWRTAIPIRTALGVIVRHAASSHGALTRLNCYQTRVVASPDLLPALGSNRKAMARAKGSVSKHETSSSRRSVRDTSKAGAKTRRGFWMSSRGSPATTESTPSDFSAASVRLRWSMVTSTPQVVGVGRDRIYDEAFVATLIVFWETADRISGKRLVPLLPLLVDALERHGRLALNDVTRMKMLQVSPATVDRLLRPARREAAGGRLRRAPAASSLKKRIPVRTSVMSKTLRSECLRSIWFVMEARRWLVRSFARLC
jgi:hypothetical protein